MIGHVVRHFLYLLRMCSERFYRRASTSTVLVEYMYRVPAKTEPNAEVGLQSLGQNISRPDQNFHVQTTFFKKTGPGDQNFQ